MRAIEVQSRSFASRTHRECVATDFEKLLRSVVSGRAASLTCGYANPKPKV